MNKLEKIKIRKSKLENSNVEIGTGLVHFIAQDSVNKFDRGISFAGLKAKQQKSIEEVLWKSEFNMKLQELGYNLAINGSGYGLVSWIIDGKPFVEWAKIFDYKKEAGELTFVALHTGRNFDYKKEQVEVFAVFKKNENGVIVKRDQVITEEGWMSINDVEVIYPGNSIPVITMRNNSLANPEIPASMQTALNTLNVFGSELPVEWSKIRSQYLNNKIFGSTKSGNEWARDMRDFKDVHDVTDPDGKLQGALSPLSSGSTTPQLLMAQIQFIEDKVLKYSFTMRESINSGTNKMNLEVAQFNQAAFEYMINKIEFRQEQLKRFFDIVFGQISELGIASMPKNYSVTLEVAELERYKIENMQAEIAEKQGRAAQASAQGNLYNEQAKVVSPEETPVEEE